MAGEPYRYRPSSPPLSAPDETADQYVKRLVPWLAQEFEALYKDMSQAVSVNVEVTPPGAPYDGMMRIFVDTGTYGWSPDDTGTGLYIYFGDAWTQVVAL